MFLITCVASLKPLPTFLSSQLNSSWSTTSVTFSCGPDNYSCDNSFKNPFWRLWVRIDLRDDGALGTSFLPFHRLKAAVAILISCDFGYWMIMYGYSYLSYLYWHDCFQVMTECSVLNSSQLEWFSGYWWLQKYMKTTLTSLRHGCMTLLRGTLELHSGWICMVHEKESKLSYNEGNSCAEETAICKMNRSKTNYLKC